MKLNGNHFKALDVSTNEKAQRIFTTECLLRHLLLPLIQFNYTQEIGVYNQNILWRSPQYVYTIQWIRFIEGFFIALFCLFFYQFMRYKRGQLNIRSRLIHSFSRNFSKYDMTPSD